MLNKELIKNTMDLIKAQPEVYDQDNWVSEDAYSPCGTTMCFAGHVAVLAGAEIPDPKKHQIFDWYVGPEGEYLNYKDFWNLNKPGESVSAYARKAMGIDNDEALYMFAHDRSVEDLELAVKELLEHGAIRTFNDDEDDYEDYCCDRCSYDDEGYECE